MTSNQHPSPKAPMTGMPACIWVEIGTLKIPAVLSTSSWLSLMTHDTYQKIREIGDQNLITKEFLIDSEKIIDGCGGTKEILKRVELNATINEKVIPIEVSVVSNLATDIILGGEFITSVKGTFHFGVGAFRWQYQNSINICNFITNPESLDIRCVTDDRKASTKKPISSSKNSQNQPNTSNESESTCWGCEFQNALPTMAVHDKYVHKMSEKNKKSSKTSSSKTTNKTQHDTRKKNEDEFFGLFRNCFLKDQQVSKTAKKTSSANKSKSFSEKAESSNSLAENTPVQKVDRVDESFIDPSLPTNTEENWKSVYVMTKELYDIFGGNPIAYNGIFWSKRNKLNLVFGEELKHKSCFGFHFIAIAKLLQISNDNKWSHLRVVSNNELVAHLLNSYLLTGRWSLREDLPFFTKADYKAYEFTCKYLNVVTPIKFESVDPSEISEMRKLERIIDAYILSNSYD